MTAKNYVSLVITALTLVVPGSAHTESVAFAPASVICAGAPFWVDSNPDPAFALINARVDIGTMRQTGDEIEAQIQWPSAPGYLMSLRAAHPGVTIPDGSHSIDRERVVCGAEEMLFQS